MNTLRTSISAVAAAAAVLASGLAAPSGASADIVWTVNATFDDGGTVTGYFDINQYGQVGNYNLQTSPNDPFGFDFVPPTAGNGYISGGTVGATEIEFFGPEYDGDQLVLFSENSLDSSGPNMLLTTSYECNFSYSCPGGGDVSVRYLESPSVLGAPEPAGWALMLIGVGGIGMAVRRRSAMSRAAC